MAVPRLMVEGPLEAGAQCDLATAQAHYLLNVMRLEDGAALRVFDTITGEWAASLLVRGKGKAGLAIGAQMRAQASGPDLHLAFALIKRDKVEWIVEKATELGAKVLQPVLTARTHGERMRTDRLQAISREAAEQCERLDVPSIGGPIRLKPYVESWPQDAPILFADEAGDGVRGPLSPWGGPVGRAQDAGAILAARLGAAATRPTRLGVLVGPEGGFTPEERAWLRAQPCVWPVTLGPRILRAETAALAMLVLAQSHWGDWA